MTAWLIGNQFKKPEYVWIIGNNVNLRRLSGQLLELIISGSIVLLVW